MRARNVAILVVAGLALGAGGWMLADRGTPPVQQEIAEGRLAFPGLAAKLDQARKITVTRGGTTLVIVRGADGVWGVADRGNYPVLATRVHELLAGLTELRLAERRTADPALLDRLGLEDPEKEGSTANLLQVLDGEDQPILGLIVGRRRVRVQANVPETVYVRRPGETQAWLAEGRIPVDNDRQLWFDRDIANIARARVARVEVTRDGGHLVFATGDDGKFALVEPTEHPDLDEYRVEDVSRGFEMLSFTDVLPDAEGPDGEVGGAVFTLTNGVRIAVRVARKGEEVWARFAASGEGEAKAEAEKLQAHFAGWAFQLGAWKEKSFAPRLADLQAEERHPQGQAPAGATPPATATPPAAADAAPPATESPAAPASTQ